MDPYVMYSRLRRIGVRLESVYWRFDDRVQLALSETADKYDARQRATKWYEFILYGFCWLAECVDIVLAWFARTRLADVWRKWEKTRYDRWYESHRAEFEREDRIRERTLRLQDEQHERQMAARREAEPKPPTEAERAQAALEAEAEDEKRKARFRDIAERDWYARNQRLMDAKYWDNPNDPKRWWNPPFPG